MENWYHKLGYEENPFTIKPAFFDDEVIGYDKEIDDLVKKLSSNKICFLEGEFGKGKSSIITYIINEFVGKSKIIHISRNRSDRALNYSKLLIEVNKGFGKLLGFKAKKTILIVDEVGKINKKDCDQILNLYKDGYIRSILFADVSLDKSKISPELKKKIGKNIVRLKDLSVKDIVDLTYSRLENKELISEALIKKIYDKSKNNTRNFLSKIELVFKKAFDEGKDKVTEEDLSVL